ncbi:GSU2403 family nucleotidyltransferase fold protein [Prescottella subtropica]|uniref:GSU2403 family nucleotidyltransferase fold protein n=1 Tax=Prescottella subtropica TaxID=2545757 RepID=UPI0010F828E2|nr:GSU2403 family nucleotidyltransferase fold protein [Prescottella subtropica]
MSRSGADGSGDLLVRTRAALLDAVEALGEHRDSVVVIGAQAIYLRTGGVPVALAESTKDADLALDPRDLSEDPRVEEAMEAAGFFLDRVSGQPGAWRNADGIPVDLMVPEALAGTGSKSARGARIPPHDRRATRRARGLEAAVVDNAPTWVDALDPADERRLNVRVASPAALLVAKLHKLGERVDTPSRLNDKDAHDIYRILRAVETEELRGSFTRLLADGVSGPVTMEAVTHLRELFASGPGALGSEMAGRAEEGVGNPDEVAVAVSFLAGDLAEVLPSM